MAKTPKNDGSTSSEYSEGAQAGAESVTDDFDFTQAILDAVKGWEEEHVGFPPYWNPESVGNAMMGKLMLKDTTDPHFVRYVFEATKAPIPCKRGPSSAQEDVIVQPGEMFTMSAYAGLPIDIMAGLEVAVFVVGKRKLPPNELSEGRPRDFWEFQVKVPPEAKKLLKARRAEMSEKLLKAAQSAPGLPAKQKEVAAS